MTVKVQPGSSPLQTPDVASTPSAPATASANGRWDNFVGVPRTAAMPTAAVPGPWQTAHMWKTATTDLGDPADKADAEKRLERNIQQLEGVQDALAVRNGLAPSRVFHSKQVAGVRAEFEVLPTIPEYLQVGFFKPGVTFPATLRFSNAAGEMRPDTQKDMRGVALRLDTSSLGGAPFQDFLMTNFPNSHVKNADQFAQFARILEESRGTGFNSEDDSQLDNLATAFVKMVLDEGEGDVLGFDDAKRILKNLKDAATSPDSLTEERFFSRAPIQFGPYAVKYRLVPVSSGPPMTPQESEKFKLTEDFYGRLEGSQPIVYELQVQPFVDEKSTPIEDISKNWDPNVSPYIPVARITIPPQPMDTDLMGALDRSKFNVWNAHDFLAPAGETQAMRGKIYEELQQGRGAPAGTPLLKCPLGFG
jgi:hypothetical protein